MMAEQDDVNKMVPQKLAEEQVKLIIKRVAMLYHYTAEVLVERFGKEQGEDLLAEIIKRYGIEVGTSTRHKVEALGLPATAENCRGRPAQMGLGERQNCLRGRD